MSILLRISHYLDLSTFVLSFAVGIGAFSTFALFSDCFGCSDSLHFHMPVRINWSISICPLSFFSCQEASLDFDPDRTDSVYQFQDSGRAHSVPDPVLSTLLVLSHCVLKVPYGVGAVTRPTLQRRTVRLSECHQSGSSRNRFRDKIFMQQVYREVSSGWTAGRQEGSLLAEGEAEMGCSYNRADLSWSHGESCSWNGPSTRPRNETSVVAGHQCRLPRGVRNLQWSWSC